MTHFDWEDANNAIKYEKDLVALLEMLERIDLPQFVVDLRVNNKEIYDNLKNLFAKEEYMKYGYKD